MMWHEFYSIPRSHSADACVDPFDDYIEETGTGECGEKSDQQAFQVEGGWLDAIGFSK